MIHKSFFSDDLNDFLKNNKPFWKTISTGYQSIDIRVLSGEGDVELMVNHLGLAILDAYSQMTYPRIAFLKVDIIFSEVQVQNEYLTDIIITDTSNEKTLVGTGIRMSQSQDVLFRVRSEDYILYEIPRECAEYFGDNLGDKLDVIIFYPYDSFFGKDFQANSNGVVPLDIRKGDLRVQLFKFGYRLMNTLKIIHPKFEKVSESDFRALTVCRIQFTSDRSQDLTKFKVQIFDQYHSITWFDSEFVIDPLLEVIHGIKLDFQSGKLKPDSVTIKSKDIDINYLECDWIIDDIELAKELMPKLFQNSEKFLLRAHAMGNGIRRFDIMIDCPM